MSNGESTIHRTLEQQSRHRGLTWSSARSAGLPFALSAVGLLSVVTFGVPPTLMLAGAWLFAALVTRTLHFLAGPASWAVGIVMETLVLGGESALVAFVDPHAHPQIVYVVMLLVPLVAGTVGWGLLGGAHTDGRRAKDNASAEPWLALIVTAVTEAVFELTKLRGPSYGLSWSMAGDSLNHILINRTILNSGGLSLSILKGAPAMVNALAAIVDGAGGRANLTTGVLIVRDIRASESIIILSSIAIGCLFIAAMTELLPKVSDRVRRVSLWYYLALLGCASLGVGSFVLGLTESGGFLSAIGGVALTMSSIVLGLRMVREPNALTLVLLTGTFAVTLISWTPLATIAGAMLITGIGVLSWRLVRRRSERRARHGNAEWVAIGFAVVVLLVSARELLLVKSTLLYDFKSSGGILGPNPGMTVWVGVGCVAVVLIAPNWQQRRLRLVALSIFAVGCAVALWLRHIGPPNVSWSYYAAKMLWLATACSIWIPFIIVTDAVEWIDKWRQLGRARMLLSVPVSLVIAGGFLWFATLETPFPAPFTFAFVGNAYPTPGTVTMMFKEVNIGGPFVLWNYTQSQNAPWANHLDDQLANFWAGLSWDFNANNGQIPWKKGPIPNFYNWAYVETPDISSLCQILENQTIRIVTSDPHLHSELVAGCPAYRAHAKQDVISEQPAVVYP
jgi:hypothetical protein